jgi:phosphatidylserine decarboxylase
VTRGQELGWFEHGSTIIMFAPKGFALCDHLRTGDRIQMGQPLMRVPHVSGEVSRNP